MLAYYVFTLLEMALRIIVYIADIQVIFGCSSRTAQRKFKRVRQHKQKANHLTAQDFCDTFQLNYQEFITALNQ